MVTGGAMAEERDGSADSGGDRELLAMARHACWRTMPPPELV
jgi:hypothetical protein